MKKIKTYKILGLIVLFGVVLSCIDEIELSTENFESLLVVEATITDQNIQQEINLSRTYRLEEEEPRPESNAIVSVTDQIMNVYTFSEAEPGNYISDIAFVAEPDKQYKLSITTSDGSKYASNEEILTTKTPMDELFFERSFNENGAEGVSVFVNTFDPLNETKYYRFEYEETYKIVAPLYSPEEFVPNDIQFPILQEDIPFPIGDAEAALDFLGEIKLRDEQELICYYTNVSNSEIITSTVDFTEDRLDKFRVQFLNRNNYIISHRYSILVRQYIQSREAHVFYETLKNFSESENILSQNQPGFLEGNLFSEDNKGENVFGFFEVSSVDVKRIYFNYEDLFPGEELPPYYTSCDDFFAPGMFVEDFAHNLINSPLLNFINDGFQFFYENEDFSGSILDEIGPLVLVLEPCGDCTFLGDNNIPEFWEE